MPNINAIMWYRENGNVAYFFVLVDFIIYFLIKFG